MEDVKFNDLFHSCLEKYPNNNAVITYNDGLYEAYTYNELGKIAENIYECIKPEIFNKQNIGVLIKQHPIISSLLYAIHQSGCSFVFLDPSFPIDNKETIQYLNITLIFSLSYIDIYESFTCIDLSELTVSLKCNLFLWTNKNYMTDQSLNLRSIAYCVRTSGSTNIPKYVAVPHKCINPNVKDFEALFEMRTTDVIYFSTPLTFDPSIIELYLAVKTGSALLIAPPQPDMFSSEMLYRVTIWQTTPSKFMLMGQHNKTVLSENSSLRVLALGGEPLYHDLNKSKHKNNRTTIFNLYGITEVSCWATINRINNKTSSDFMALETILSETQLKIAYENDEDKCNKIGEILIGGINRKCLINEEIISKQNILDTFQVQWRNTGDLGQEIDGIIYFKGRCNRSVKRFGHKIDLLNIELIASKYEGINECFCLWSSEHHSLILFYTSESDLKNGLHVYLQESLNVFSQPDDIIRIESMPINNNGKISNTLIEDIYKDILGNQKITSFKHIFIQLLTEILKPKQFTIRDLDEKSFYDIGGTSIQAAQLVNMFENITKMSFAQLYVPILDSKYPLIKIIEILNIPHKTIDKVFDYNKVEEDKCDSRMEQLTNHGSSIGIIWKYNTKKCIDSNPTIYKNYITGDTFVMVGSHSGLIVVLDAFTGSKIYEFNAESRIESPILVCNNSGSVHGVVGCYDGSFLSFSPYNCKINWKIPLNAMIKSQACLINEYICVGTYDGVLYIIEPKVGKIVQSIKIATKGISADLVSSENVVYAGCLDGRCGRIKITQNTATMEWVKTLESPIFAKPLLVEDRNQIIFNEVNKKIHCFDSKSGDTIWIFGEVKGLLFSSCTIYSDKDDCLIFGCHDRYNYNISYCKNSKPVVKWKTRSPSEIYATPCLKDGSSAISFSTDGTLQVIDMSSGKVTDKFSMPGEVFSSPIIEQNYIFIGCRDDNLYCLKIK